MTTNSQTFTFDTDTDAHFRAWGLGISTAFAACGLVQTTDTGQINWSTVTRTGPTSSGQQISGYEIWRFNDSLQATKPVFIKVEYGLNVFSAGSARIPCVITSTATATNGAGTLTIPATTSPRQYWLGSTQGDPGTGNQAGVISASSPLLMQGDGSSVVAAIGAQAVFQPTYANPSGWSFGPNFPAFLLIERTRDTAGVINGDGLIVGTVHYEPPGGSGIYNAATQGHSPVPAWQMVSYTGSGLGAVSSRWPIAWPGNAFSTAVSGSDLYAYPMPVATPKAEGQALGFLGIYKSDLAIDTIISLTVSGSAHTYRSLAGIAGIATNNNERSYVDSNVANGALLMRWE